MRAKLQPSVVWKIIFYNKFPYLWYLRVWTHFLFELLSIRRCMFNFHSLTLHTHTHARAHSQARTQTTDTRPLMCDVWLAGCTVAFSPAASSNIT